MSRVSFGIEDQNATSTSQADGKPLKIDRRDSLIIGSDCRRIMRSLCSREVSMGKFSESAGEITQPTFLSSEDRVIFFKTKMFYLLQERKCLKEKRMEERADGKKGAKKFADAYPSNLSPFCEIFLATGPPEPSVKTNRIRESLIQRMSLSAEGRASERASGFATIYKGRMKANTAVYKTGIARFLENIRKGDQTVLRILEEKILKTMEGTGYAVLIGEKDIRKLDILMNIFPDFNLLMADGRDEESKLTNLVSHVRTRIKVFEKLQSFFENRIYEDHTAHVFALTNQDKAEIRPEIVSIGAKRMHDMDEKKMQKLFAIFKDDYGTAKTTLVADGTQPVVLNRKKLDRIKKYVEDCADFKGSMMVPYVREMNFFFLSFPWKYDAALKKGGESPDTAL